ncbi:MAG: DUF3164 family protein [Phocaeicola sp.]
MEENKKQVVEMTAEEKAQFEAFKVEQAEKLATQKAKDDRVAYKQLVDEIIESTIPELLTISEDIKTVKKTALENFKQVLDMKAEVMGVKLGKNGDQRSHTFTNTEGNKRITLGVYETDGYRDTVEDGIAIVKECIEELGQDDKSKVLVRMVLKLLARDAKGTLKASRVVQLRKTAEELGDKRLLEGVQIIEESYQPAVSKQFIRAEVKNDVGAWVSVPLGMTEA